MGIIKREIQDLAKSSYEVEDSSVSNSYEQALHVTEMLCDIAFPRNPKKEENTSNLSCGANAKKNSVVDDKIDYQQLQRCKLVELKLANNAQKLFITMVEDGKYIDIFSKKEIYSSSSHGSRIQLLNEYILKDYLVTYKELKDSYTLEDIQRIYNKINEDYVADREKLFYK